MFSDRAYLEELSGRMPAQFALYSSNFPCYSVEWATIQMDFFFFFCWLKVSSWVDEMWSSWMVLRWILYISYNNEIVPSLCWGFQWSIRLFFSYEVWIFDYLSFELWLQLENFFRRWFNLNSLSLFGKSMRLQFYSDLRKDFSIYIFLMKALQLKITELCFISSRKK